MAGIFWHVPDSYTPPDIAAFADLWLDTDQITSLNNGDDITTWSDESGNGRDALSIYARAPKYYTNVVNGKPVIRFTYTGGSAASGGESMQTSGFSITEKLIVFIVYKPNNFVDNAYIFNDNTLSKVFLLNQDPSPGIQIWAGGFGPMVDQTIGEFGVITCYIDGGNSWMRRNSGTKSTASLSSVSGGSGITLSTFGEYDITEFILDTNSTLTDGEITEVEDYLLLKYGL